MQVLVVRYNGDSSGCRMSGLRIPDTSYDPGDKLLNSLGGTKYGAAYFKSMETGVDSRGLYGTEMRYNRRDCTFVCTVDFDIIQSGPPIAFL